LGADEKVFENIDFSNFNPVFIKWVDHTDNQSIESYAMTLSRQIVTERPILLGLSFGGILSVEIAKKIQLSKLILISSAKTKYEVPKYFRYAVKLGLLKVLPDRFLNKSNFIFNYFFGITNIREKELLKEILIETKPQFIRWALTKIASWENIETPKNCIHIHGTLDRILPIKNIQNKISIENGGHFMISNKADEISKIILQELTNTN